MATALRLRHIADEKNIPMKELLITTIEEHGSIIRASAFLGVSPNTLKYNLNANGLKVVQITKVVKK